MKANHLRVLMQVPMRSQQKARNPYAVFVLIFSILPFLSGCGAGRWICERVPGIAFCLPDPSELSFACDSHADCPSGQTCDDGHCREHTHTSLPPPDLTPAGFSINQYLIWGEDVLAQIHIKNIGEGYLSIANARFNVRYVLSADMVWGNSDDSELGVFPSGFCVDAPLSTIPLQPGSTCGFRQLITLPSHPPHRDYLDSSIAYVGIFIDPDNAVSEESDDNNGPYTGKFPGKPEQTGWDDFSVPTLVIESASVVEGNDEFSVLEFQINIAGVDPTVYDREISFNFATDDGTASYRENDYLSNNGEIRISPGSSALTLHVYVYGDHVTEPDEDMWLTFSHVKNAYTNQNRARGLIIDDD